MGWPQSWAERNLKLWTDRNHGPNGTLNCALVHEMRRADSKLQLEEMRGREHAGVMGVRGEAKVAALVCLVRLASPDLFV